VRRLLVRALQVLALYAPGATSVRVWLHRRRGVKIGRRVFIGADAIIETDRPELVSIGDGVTISIRVTIVAHFRGATPAERGEGAGRYSVRIEENAFIGPGSIILPGVVVHAGGVVAAGSVVSSAVPALTMVQGNPARPVARCGIPLGPNVSADDFYRNLRPLKRGREPAPWTGPEL
jgi:acetyltransferase-like isoleucine patch superfamily enzyme